MSPLRANDAKYVDRLRAMRQLGESYSDVIVRLAEASEGARGVVAFLGIGEVEDL